MTPLSDVYDIHNVSEDLYTSVFSDRLKICVFLIPILIATDGIELGTF